MAAHDPLDCATATQDVCRLSDGIGLASLRGVFPRQLSAQHPSFWLLHCAAVLLLACATAFTATAAGVSLFPLQRTTGEKPQSKIFHHGGSYWAVLSGQDGLGVYERRSDNWTLRNLLGSAGKADVKLSDATLYVLVFTSEPHLHVLDYDQDAAAWITRSGSPNPVPKIHASEALVLEQDSSGRLWYTAEGDGDVQVFYSTGAGGSAWSATPIVLESDVNEDDISSVISFGGDRIGVFWSDQSRERFGFRVHRDGDPPDQWSSTEIVFAGTGNADDHLNLATDSQGRVFAVTKDARDQLHVHRRDVDGAWTTSRDVSGSAANRGIVMVDEAGQTLWVLYANRDRSPAVIEYRRANANTLVFGEPIEFIASTSDLDDVSGLKQPLPVGSLVAVATRSDQTAWWNAFDPPDPSGLTARRVAPGSGVEDSPSGVVLRWNEPGFGTPDSYRVYRRELGGTFQRIDNEPLRENVFVDSQAPADLVCYQVTAVHAGIESSPTNERCVDLSPADPSTRLRLRVQPNPFNPSTHIRFRLSSPTHVDVVLHDALGRRVSRLASRVFPAGESTLDWNGLGRNGRPAAAGVYLLVLHLNGHLETRKITLVK